MSIPLRRIHARFGRIRPLILILAAAVAASVLPGRMMAEGLVPSVTLAEHDKLAIDAALDGKEPGSETQNVFSSQRAAVYQMAKNLFVRNPALWIGPKVDLTAISAYSDGDSGHGSKFALTAVSPIHCIGAHHCGYNVGVRLNFVGSDNTTVTRKIVAVTHPVGDINVYLLNQELPACVTPMRMLPPDWSRYLPTNQALNMPVIFINQQSRLYCAEAYGITMGDDPLVVYQMPSTLGREIFNTQIVSGDSSFPEMVLVHGQPAILSLWLYGGYGVGPLEAVHFAAINRAMTQLSRDAGLTSDYQLRTPDLSGIARL